MNKLLTDAANRAMRYLDALPERRVAPNASALRGLAAFDTALPKDSHFKDPTPSIGGC